MKRLWWSFLNALYTGIRYFCMKDFDPNEDFFCCGCFKPVLNRYIFCSKECAESVPFGGILSAQKEKEPR